LIVEELIKYNKERMYESESEEREERDWEVIKSKINEIENLW
jgi:hypothetical protein